MDEPGLVNQACSTFFLSSFVVVAFALKVNEIHCCLFEFFFYVHCALPNCFLLSDNICEGVSFPSDDED